MPHDFPHNPAMGFEVGIQTPGKNALLPVTWADKCQVTTATNYVFKRAIERGITGTLFGPSNCGKTFLALDFGLRAACGIEWRGHRVKQCAVLYIACEGVGGIDARIEAWKLTNLTEDRAAIPFGVVRVPLDLFQGTDREKVMATVLHGIPEGIESADIGLVIVDTLARTIGAGDENSNADMSRYARNIEAIASATGATVIVLHHNGKDVSKGARGGYALTCAVDLEIEVTVNDGTRTAIVKKQRDGETGQEYHFELDRIEVGTDDEGDEITSCVVRYLDEGPKSQPKISGAEKRARDLLAEAINTAGKTPPPSPHIPTNVQAVNSELWREYCYSGALSSSQKPGTQRQAFNRAKQDLLRQGVIGTWDQWVWLA